MDREESVLKIFPSRIRQALEQTELNMENLQEIRVRVGQPLLCVYRGREFFLAGNGKLEEQEKNPVTVSGEELLETVSYVSRYSLYAFDEELRQGYITIPGGHRVGIAGKIVMEGEKIRSVRYISFLNVRLSHEKKGCADRVFPYLVKNGRFCHTLIISPPRCGKTTLLRDIIRQASNGNDLLAGQNVGVVDERSEIGGSYRGVPQNDLGIRTDVLDCCPKAEGMMMLIRSMSPEVVAVDEIGTAEDLRALESVLNCGCRILATVHGNSMEDVRQKPLLGDLVERHVFQRYILLSGKEPPGTLQAVFDGRGTRLYQKGVGSCCGAARCVSW